jgi:hypothetical protein
MEETLPYKGILEKLTREGKNLTFYTVFNKAWRTPKFLERLKRESEMQTAEEQGVEARSLVCNTLGVEGHAGVPGWD